MADLIKRIERQNGAMYYNRRSPEHKKGEDSKFARWYNQEQANTNETPMNSERDLPRLSSGLTNSEDLLLLMQEQGRHKDHLQTIKAYNGRFLRLQDQ